MANRLADSTSPYLLQHKNNPVDWYPWGEEAFGRARREDKPIFLSVGYSSCHWCHVMEHESFEDEGVAKLLNESFVSIKVDREERPDVDEALMAGVQLSSGRGGWPMSVFLTPDLKPFFAGTYFPKEDREGSPGFRTVLAQIASGWSKKRSEFQKAADEFAQAIGQHLTREAPKTFAKPSQEILDNAVRAIASEFDQDNGGFGGAPKFPPHSTIAFLLEYAAAENSPEDLAQVALSMALLTLEAMALGGIHDHVGGGFHRYSTDAEWILPHFEKMLYDNALLLENYANAARLTLQAEPQLGTYFAETAAKIIEWLNHRMAAENGLYGSALDADSEGTEGKYYVWTVDELRSTLGGRADRFMESFSVRAEGNYHDESTGTLSGKNILYNSEHADEPFEEELEALLHSRNGRTPPSYDDKQIVAWNALLLSGFVMAGEIEVAEGIARAILDAEREHGRLPHQIGDGKPAGDAFLDDYAALVLGLWSLAAAIEATEEFTGNARWQAEAERLQDKMVALFYDSEEGGFFYTSSAHEELFGRSKPVFDQPIPSGNAMAIQALVRSGDLDRAGKSLQPLIGWMERVPHATESLLIALLDLLEAENSDRPIRESAAPPLSPQTTEVSVAIIPKEIRADGRGTGKGTVVFQIPNGMHLNSHEPPARWLIPTCVTVQPLNARVDYPPAQNDEYSGKLEIPFTVELPAGEGGADFEVKVTYQACDDKACQLPEEKSLSGVLVRG